MLKTNAIIIMTLVIGFSAPLGLLGTHSSLADESMVQSYDDSYGVRHRVISHPYLDVKVWLDKGEGATYHPSENIKVYFRASHDCYVVIYDIDTRGYVNLLYPTDSGDDPYVEGGRVYRIPDRFDDYDLTIDGPDGVEYIQAVASLEPIDYPNFPSAYSSEDEEIYAYKLEGEYPFEFMTDINNEISPDDYASDVCIFNVEYQHPKWYYWPEVVYAERPVDVVWGGVYFGDPWGVEVWIDGVFYGITPLTIPALVVGRHYCSFWFHGCWIWRDWFHVRPHHTIRVWPDCRDRYRYVEERVVEKSYRAEKAKRRRGTDEMVGLLKPGRYGERERMAKTEAYRINKDKEFRKDLSAKRRGLENRTVPSRLSDPKSNRVNREIKTENIRKSSAPKRTRSVSERKIKTEPVKPDKESPRELKRSYEPERSRQPSQTQDRINRGENSKPKAGGIKTGNRENRETKSTSGRSAGSNEAGGSSSGKRRR